MTAPTAPTAAAAAGVLDNRPTITYRGDVTGDIGRIVGPNTAGEYLVMDDATHDPETGRTTARFRYATPTDFDDPTRLPLHWPALPQVAP